RPGEQEVGMSGKKWTLGGVAGALVLAGGGVAGALVLAGGTGRAPAQPAGAAVPAPAAQPKAAAVVNGEAITLDELEWALRLPGPSPQQLSEAQQRLRREEA